MKPKQTIYLNIILMTLFLWLMPCNVLPVNAQTVNVSGITDISPTDSQLKSSKNPKYNSTTQKLNESISQSYTMNIYHYEAPSEGYYVIYTTGSLDTVGAVYEEQNVLFFKTSYELVACCDDGYFLGDVKNCKMLLHMDKGEDYYICIRAFANGTGNYDLVIEPNEDKILSSNGGIWEETDITNGARNLGIWTKQKVYLNKEQTLLLYILALENEGRVTYVPDEYDYFGIAFLKESLETNPQYALNIANLVINLSMAKEGAATGIVLTILQFILGQAVNFGSTIAGTQNKDLSEVINQNCTVSLVRSKPQNGSVSIVLSIKKGLLIQQIWNQSAPHVMEYYSAFDSNLLVGEKYYYGKWK